jgi:hypothetical protein
MSSLHLDRQLHAIKARRDRSVALNLLEESAPPLDLMKQRVQQELLGASHYRKGILRNLKTFGKA